jgi:NDP-sugar pyrophosphorylase family protein
MKAMFLAAGLGERLLPLTRVVPKPLIPVLGRPLASQILSKMAAEGIYEAVINLHHLPQRLRDALGDGGRLGLRALHYSLEEGELLGTGGGLAHAAHWLKGSGTILVRNSDFVADIPLAKALASHLRSGCPATLVVAPHRAGYTPVELDARGRVAAFGGKDGKSRAMADRYLFTGYHLLEESILASIPHGRPSDIVRDVYVQLAAEGRLNAHVHDGFWWEFGEPREYLEGSMRLIDLSADRRSRLGDFDLVRSVGDALVAVGAGADLHTGGIALTGRVAIGLGVMVGEGAVVEDSVIMPEAWVGPGSTLRRCIVGPGTEIPVGFEAAHAIVVTDPEPDSALPAGTERIASLLVRRFEGAASR